MITFITALYEEAKPLITELQLKKQSKETLYQLFEGEQIRLLVTGSGMIAAAAAAARHFAHYPADKESDLIINLGIAGYVMPSDKADASGIGDLFLVSKITEQTTGRTFYPDFLYRHSFALRPLITVPMVSKDTSACFEGALIDMEASALYQVLLPHISPDRILFFKVISDLPGQASQQPVHPDELLKPYIPELISHAFRLHEFLQSVSSEHSCYTEEELQLSERIRQLLPMTETMTRDFERLLTYAKLSGSPLSVILQGFCDSLFDTIIRGKKQAMPYLEQLREQILNEPADTTLPKTTAEDTSLYQPFFATVYAEKNVLNTEWQSRLSASPILIDHYKDVFNRSHQNFAAQKKAPALILAKKAGTLIYKGAPVCQSFGNEHFYYTSCMMNCIYHCDYCYLQGMYPSGHVVVFVNLEDYFTELEQLLKAHPVYLCVSYDTDLLALENTFSFVSRWLSFAAEHPTLTLEIRTKSGNSAVFEKLAALYEGCETQKEQIIFAWTVSPDNLCRTTEHGAASLNLRLTALLAAKAAGFSVRLCFDPMIFHAGWKEAYSALVEYVFSRVPADCLYDVSIGVFRISTEYIKNMRKKRPDCAIVQYPYITENGVSHYGTLSEEMVHYLQELLLPHLPAERIFIWNGENKETN